MSRGVGGSLPGSELIARSRHEVAPGPRRAPLRPCPRDGSAGGAAVPGPAQVGTLRCHRSPRPKENPPRIPNSRGSCVTAGLGWVSGEGSSLRGWRGPTSTHCPSHAPTALHSRGIATIKGPTWEQNIRFCSFFYQETTKTRRTNQFKKPSMSPKPSSSDLQASARRRIIRRRMGTDFSLLPLPFPLG